MKVLGPIKEAILSAAHAIGYDITRTTAFGKNPLVDIAAMAGSQPGVIFDVGANEGQTAVELRKIFPGAMIYCFEPFQPTFALLRKRLQGRARFCLESLALGEDAGTATFYQNSNSFTNSLLPNAPEAAQVPHHNAMAIPVGQMEVQVDSIDAYCERHKLSTLDVLKMDCQGYELKILRGAARMLERQAITFIFLEVAFVPIYSGQAYFHEINQYLVDAMYNLVGFYGAHRSPEGKLLWCDALFRKNQP